MHACIYKVMCKKVLICDRLWENQTIGAEFSIELQLNLCLQYKSQIIFKENTCMYKVMCEKVLNNNNYNNLFKQQFCFQ